MFEGPRLFAAKPCHLPSERIPPFRLHWSDNRASRSYYRVFALSTVDTATRARIRTDLTQIVASRRCPLRVPPRNHPPTNTRTHSHGRRGETQASHCRGWRSGSEAVHGTAFVGGVYHSKHSGAGVKGAVRLEKAALPRGSLRRAPPGSAALFRPTLHWTVV